MKKLLALMLTVIVLASFTLTAFAVSVDYTFKMTAEDGIDYIYHFGSLDEGEEVSEDTGIIINNKKYSLVKDNDTTQLEKAKSSKKFGVGILDENNILGDTYSATPYVTVGGEDKTGAITTVVKAETKSANANLKALSVSGETLYPAFSNDVTEYYVAYPEGQIPDVLPEVSYTKDSSNATVESKTENNKTTITVTAENGATKTYTVTFAEWVEKTLVADKLTRKRTSAVYSKNDEKALPIDSSITNYTRCIYFMTNAVNCGGNTDIYHFNFNLTGEGAMPEEFVMIDAQLSLYARVDSTAYATPENKTLVISKTDEDWTVDGYTKPAQHLISATPLAEKEIETNAKAINYKDISAFNEYTVSLDASKFSKPSDLMLSFHKKEVETVKRIYIYLEETYPVTLTVKYIKK